MEQSSKPPNDKENSRSDLEKLIVASTNHGTVFTLVGLKEYMGRSQQQISRHTINIPYNQCVIQS